MRGLEHRTGTRFDKVQALADWSQEGLEGWHHHSILHLGGDLSSCGTQRDITMYIPWGRTRTLLYHYCLTAFFLFLYSFVPLRSLITETCSRASTAAWLASQNGLRPKMASLKKAIPGVSVVAQWLTNPTRNHEVAALIPGLCSVG